MKKGNKNGRYLVPCLALILASCSNPATIDSLKSINCQHIERSELDVILKDQTKHAALPTGTGEQAVKVRFNIDATTMKDVLLVVYSGRTGESPLYQGPFADEIDVFPSPELYDQEGLDNLDFQFFDNNNQRICRQQQDGGTQYWKRGKNILIEFLVERETDPAIGTPLGHKVHLE